MDLGPSEQQLNGPALAPPDGVLPNLTNPPNQNALGIAVTAVCLFLGTFAVLLRAYSRVLVSRKLHIEDLLGLVAFGFYVGLAWSVFAYTNYVGFLVHQWNVQLKNLVSGAHAAFYTTFLYTFAMLFGKTAILVEWTRIFVVQYKRQHFFYLASRAVIVLNVIAYTAFGLIFIVFCIPPEKNWKSWVPGRCLEHRPHDLAIVSINLALDLLILVLPQRFIWSLQMPYYRKIGVSAVFSVGLLACASAIGRTILVTRLDYDGDILYELSKTFLFAFVEVTCVILVFCVPAIPRAFSQNTILFRAVSAVRSWTQGLMSTSQENSKRSDNGASVFPPTIGSEPNKHIQRPCDSEEQALSLTDLTAMRDQLAGDYHSLGSTGQGSVDWGQHGENTIVVTKQVDQLAEAGSRSSVDRSIGRRQHVWE
ncbi:hypothetical protein F5B21DRAFT_485070 [Xylaria acuta]|nr:hypothetical protein F5B21DRAFT_485070 [Xylaria acuta]